MKYIVYLTTNLKSKINNINRIYIGVHQTNDPTIFDGYIGCGVYKQQPSTYMYPKTAFLAAVKKYGVDAFHRDILFIYDNKQDAYKKEAELVTEDFIKLPHVYNMIIGGIYENIGQPIYQFDLNGNLQHTWQCINDAAEFYGVYTKRFLGPIKNQCVFLNSLWSRHEIIDINDFSIYKQTNTTYLYSIEGKLLNIFDSLTECAKFINYDTGEITRAIQNNTLIKKQYYISNTLIDEFVPSSRKLFINKIFYVYDKNGNLLSKCIGKELMNIIHLHSWDYVGAIFSHNHNWYKDFYISFEMIDKIPNKRFGNGIAIDIYDQYGNFIEHMDSIKDVREKYNIPSCKLKNIQKGNKYYNNYIFKYSK